MARAELRDQAVILDSLRDSLAQAEMVFITTPDPVFQALTAVDFDRKESVLPVIDFWRILDKELAGRPNIRYVPVGRSIDDAANATRLAALWNSIGPES